MALGRDPSKNKRKFEEPTSSRINYGCIVLLLDVFMLDLNYNLPVTIIILHYYVSIKFHRKYIHTYVDVYKF